MDMKKMLLVAIGIATLLLAVTAVTASTWTSNTPLFIYRMEQHSSKMSFLPAEMNGLTYTTEQGYELTYEVSGYLSGIGSFDVETDTPGSVCDTCWTCSNTCVTCPATCPWTCGSTHLYSCGGTCGYSCGGTCDTCVTKPCK